MTTLIDSETQHSIKTKVDIHEMAAMLKVGPSLLAFSFGF